MHYFHRQQQQLLGTRCFSCHWTLPQCVRHLAKTLQQIKQQLQHAGPVPASSSSSLSATSQRHYYYHCAPCHSFCLAWDSLIIYNHVLQTLILIYTLTLLMSAFAFDTPNSPDSYFAPSYHSPFCCVRVSCYLQRAWAVNLLPQCLLCSTLGQHAAYT